jgi:glycogen operon protein
MNDQDWSNSWIQCLGLFLSGNLTDEIDMEGKTIPDDSLLIIFNAYHEDIPFMLPESLFSGLWEVDIDTVSDLIPPGFAPVESGKSYLARGRSLVLLRQDKLKSSD